MTQLTELLQIRRFTPGRAAFAAKSIQALTNKGEEAIAAEADRVREAARGSLDKRRAWKQARNKKTSARGGGKAAELDNQVDRLVSAIYGNVQSFVRALDEDDDEVLKAKELLNELFPVGASDITSLSFEEQAAAVQHLLQDLEGRFQGHVAALGLAPLVERLSVVHAAFADALGHASPGGVAFDVVAAAENEVQEALAGLMMVICAHYRGSDPAKVARRGQLLAPILDQDARIGDAFRRRRPMRDVNPDTGAETDEDE